MRCLTLLILIMRGLMDLFRRRPVWAGASAPPGTGPASARAPKLRCAPSRLASRPVGRGPRRSRASGLPTGTPRSRPDGGSLPNAAHRRTRQRRQSAPVHANALETPPCAPGADPLPPQRPARRPSADRTMHSNEKRLLSNSKSLRSPNIGVLDAGSHGMIDERVTACSGCPLTRRVARSRHVRALRLRSDRTHIWSGPGCGCVCGAVSRMD